MQHLVLKHLRMYHVATRRDIDDPATLEEFCGEVHGREGLRELYLLTVARRVDDQPDRAHELEGAHARRALPRDRSRALGGRAGARGEAGRDEVRESVRALCPERGEREFLDHFLTPFPSATCYANDPDDIVRHSRFARARRR